ncbi:MAG TPA: Asp-tRNA(Asn)/Glu-tRNA(Gln) amidotransferase subunit GatB, partial [Burkholderiales bacterium]|nr:Asp-tRNA(Asn)/Glu-tRNA(Gln) amidotransferase subunit GatB [Burkholderiales bacterium]
MNWEIVIGLETHAQLSTASKMFSGASTAFGAAPNTQASAVDIALPGVLPVANKAAVERAIRFGLAVNGGDPKNINRRSVFARKNYFYPDLPKGYQISQYELPIVKGGEIAIFSPTRGEIKIRLTRAHLEEDAGKSVHGDDVSGLVGAAKVGEMTVGSRWFKYSAIDLNRAGIPLLEIVSEPEMQSAEEAVAYAKTLHTLVRWIGICDGNMQEGSFRCDANVSVRRPGAPLGTRCEIKNLNSFRFLERAIDYEAKRQIEVLEDGGRIIQETRLYDSDRDETCSMRAKEEAHDYRYFPDPDLPPLVVGEEWLERVRNELPELPHVKRKYYQEKLLLFEQDAEALTSSLEVSQYFEAVLGELRKIAGIPYGLQKPDVANSKHVANWIINDISSYLNRDNISITQCPVSPLQLAQLLARIFDNTLSSKTAKEVFDAMWMPFAQHDWPTPPSKPQIQPTDIPPNLLTSTLRPAVDEIIEKRGLKQISDAGAIEKIVDQVLAANAKQVEDYRAGKEKAFN